MSSASRLFAPILAIAMAASSFAEAAKLTEPVHVTSGDVQGKPGIPGVTAFKGIPYVAPPIGNLRWRPPQPALKWSGILKADKFGPICPGAGRPLAADGQPAAQLTANENCLFMNIWSGATDSHDRLPVMVWIHGGGYREGAGSDSQYDGGHLAQKGAVVVNFNYRMGVLGFLAHPALSAESQSHTSGNYGLMDMIAALRWVQDNIAEFGGDPGRVTIFGQSSGSLSVSLLSISPSAKGLFQRIIGQSGAGLGANPYTTLKPLAYGEMHGAKFTQSLGLNTLTEMRAVPAETFVKAIAGQPIGFLDPVLDGQILPAEMAEVYRRGGQSDVPMLLGNTTRESGPTGRPHTTAAAFRADIGKCYGPAGAKSFFQAYPVASDVDANTVSNHSFDVLMGAWSMRNWALLEKAHGKSPVYMYTFDQAAPFNPSRGAYHASDLFYSFNNLDNFRSLDWTKDDHAVAEAMSSYWVNFAATGNPNGVGLAPWPAYDPEAEVVMLLKGPAVHAEPLPEVGEIEALDNIKAAQRILPPEDRC